MPYNGGQRVNCYRNVSVVQIQALLITMVMASAFIVGCSHDQKYKSPNLAGTFSGVLPDGKHMTITFKQSANIISGHGVVDSKSFSVSGVTSIHGPIVIAFENGHVEKGNVVLLSRGKSAQVEWLGKNIILQRGGEPITLSTGDFTGKYSINKPYPVSVSIAQKNNVLAGTGYITGKAIALVGIVDSGSMCAKGIVLYSDGSSANTKACLSSDDQALILNEADTAGSPITLRRRSP